MCPMIIPIGTAINTEKNTATTVYCRCSSDPGGQPGRPAPVGRGEDERQRLLEEVHAAAAFAFGRATRPRAGRSCPRRGQPSREHDQRVDDDRQHEDRDDARR